MVEFEELPSSVRVNIDFDRHCCGSLDDLLQQLQHVEELNFSNGFIGLLSVLVDRDYKDLSSLLLNNKSLILYSPDFGDSSTGIAYALGMSHVLNKLVIKDPVLKVSNNVWNISGTASDFSMLHLKTVHITGLSKRKDKCKVLLDFVRFIQNNAPLLETLEMLKDV